MRRRSLLILLLSAFLTNSCGDNILRDLSTKDSAAALYEDATKLATQEQYDLAFAKLSEISSKYPDFASSDKFKMTTAGVQAGQCGLNFINFIQGISAAAGSQIFLMLMQAFRATAVNPLKCVDAQATMATLSNVENDQLLFLAILGMTKVGSYIRDRADRTTTTGDGTVDVGFSSCTETTSATTLDDTDMREVITGFSLILRNVTLIGGSFAGSDASGAIDAINTFCADPIGSGDPADAIDCAVTDPAAISPAMIRVFRRMLDSTEFGVGSCTITSNPALCCPSLPFP